MNAAGESVGASPQCILASAAAAPAPRYRVVNGCLSRARRDVSGAEIVEPLAGFDARVDEELLYDDGAETFSVFVVSGRSQDGQPLRPLRVTAGEFATMSWVAKGWGTAGIIEAGAKDHLRAAILKLSRPRQRRIFRRTGWVEIGGEWTFLYQGGAVGAAGVEVELDAPLDRFRLPTVVDDLPGAIRTSLSLLDCGPPAVTFPLLGTIYLAPVSFILNPDAVTWAFGETGSLKSEIASLVQAHFGDFDRKSLPANWSSTTASIESRLFTAADVVVTLDDFAPQASRRADGELRQRAERILRSIGNHAARGRAHGDLTHRPDHPPRGVVLSTGESLPPGHSINARLVPIEVDRSRLDLAAVTRLQAQRQRLPHALRGYVEWLRPRISELRETLPARREELRAAFHQSGGHLRQGDALAHLYLGIELFSAFAEECGAMTAEESAALRTQAREALLAVGGGQTVTLARADPAERFIEVLSTLLAQRRVYLEVTPDDGSPPAGGTQAGYRTLTSALVLPEPAYKEVAASLREQGEHWAPVPSQLHAALVRRGYVIPDAEGRAISQHRIGSGRRPRVLDIPLVFLAGERDEPGMSAGAVPASRGRLQQPSQPSLRSGGGPSEEDRTATCAGGSS